MKTTNDIIYQALLDWAQTRRQVVDIIDDDIIELDSVDPVWSVLAERLVDDWLIED